MDDEYVNTGGCEEGASQCETRLCPESKPASAFQGYGRYATIILYLLLRIHSSI